MHHQGETLVFAMNGGMYLKDKSPQGLYIENGVMKSKVDTIRNAYGNFYLQPNGIFFISPILILELFVKTQDFINEEIKYATQSGPLLVIDGKIHSKFRKGSSNLNIRNGVGILPNGNVIFAMSKNKVNLFDFATYFKSKGCKKCFVFRRICL